MAGKKVLLDDLIEKQTESLKKIEQYTSIMRLADIASAMEEKKILDDENILVAETKIIRTSIISILDHVIDLKEKLLASLPTQEDKNEQLSLQEEQLNALQKLSEGQKARQGVSEGMSLGKVVAGIAVALGALTGTVSAYVKNVKFWLDLLTPEKIFQKLKNFDKELGKVIVGVADTIKSTFSKGFKLIFESKPLQAFFDTFNKIIDFVKKPFVASSMDKFNRFFNNQRESILTRFMQPFVDAFKFIREFFTSPSVKALDESKTIFTTIGENLGKFGKLFGAVSKIVGKLLLPLNIIMTAWDVVKSTMDGYEKEGIVGAIQGAVTGLFNSVIGSMLDLLKDASSWVLEKLGFNEASEALDSFSFQDLIADFIDAIMHPLDTIQQLINGLMISITEGVNGIIDKVNAVLPDSFKIPTLDVPEKRVSEREGKRPSDVNKKEQATSEVSATEKSAGALTQDEKKKYYEIYSKKINEGTSHSQAADAMEDARIADIRAKPDPTEDEKKQLEAYDYFKNKRSAESGVNYVLKPEMERPIEFSPNYGATPEAVTPTTAEAVAEKTTETKQAQEALLAPSGNTVVSAPVITTSNNTIQNQSIRMPVRMVENTINRYVTSRYAVQ